MLLCRLSRLGASRAMGEGDGCGEWSTKRAPFDWIVSTVITKGNQWSAALIALHFTGDFRMHSYTLCFVLFLANRYIKYR